MKFLLVCKIVGLVNSTPLQKTSACGNKYVEIYEETVRNPNQSVWNLVPDRRTELAIKKHCQKHIWDIEFCTQVCELQTGDICDPRAGVGSDRCNEGLECTAVDSMFKCEPVLLGEDYFPSFSSDSSYGDSDSSWYGF
jgi:hypothetical protein